MLREDVVVAVEVPLIDQLIFVDDKECRRPACLEVIYQAAISAAVPDGLDLGGVGVVGGQLIETGDGRCVVNGASGESFEIFVVGFPQKMVRVR